MNKKGFTLVELIVVITILAILWTIAFISFQWYTKSSRDSVRISDSKNIEKALELYKLQTWEYPAPEEWVAITYSWAEVWTQWIAWTDVVRNLDKLNKVPRDPLTWNEYTYSRLNTKKEFEIWAALEWSPVVYNFDKLDLINKSYANDIKSIATAYVIWSYNWQIAKVSTWSTTYILAVPTIINWDLNLTDIIEIISAKKLVYNWYWNLPSSYTWTIFEMDWWFDYSETWWIVVYSWSISNLETDEDARLELISNLQDVYSWTILENTWNIKQLVETDIDTEDPSDEAKILAWWTIDNSIWTHIVEKLELTWGWWSSWWSGWEWWAWWWWGPQGAQGDLLTCELTPTQISNLNSLLSDEYISLPVDLADWNSGQIDDPVTEEDRCNVEYLDWDWYMDTNIDTDIFLLPDLKGLSLYATELDTLPPEFFTSFNGLEILYLDENSFTSLPSWLNVYADTLIELSFYENYSVTNIDWIWEFTNLTYLDFEENEISNIPSEIWNLVNLDYLYLGWNYMNTLPHSLIYLRNLSNLDLYWYGTLWNLKRFFDQDSSLKSQPLITDDWKTMTIEWDWSYIIIDVPSWWWDDWCYLTQGEISNLNSLLSNWDLSVYNSGSINLTTPLSDKELCTEVYWLSWNWWSTIDTDIFLLKWLKELSLNGAGISSLPSWFSSAYVALEYLDIWWNNFTSVPSEIRTWYASSLKYLHLDGNPITNIYNWLYNMTSLLELSLYDCDITKDIYDIWTLTNLETLNLRKNQLVNLPSGIDSLSNLENLNLSENPWLWNLNSSFTKTSTALTQDWIFEFWEELTIEWNWSNIVFTTDPWFWSWWWWVSPLTLVSIDWNPSYSFDASKWKWVEGKDPNPSGTFVDAWTDFIDISNNVFLYNGVVSIIPANDAYVIDRSASDDWLKILIEWYKSDRQWLCDGYDQVQIYIQDEANRLLAGTFFDLCNVHWGSVIPAYSFTQDDNKYYLDVRIQLPAPIWDGQDWLYYIWLHQNYNGPAFVVTDIEYFDY